MNQLTSVAMNQLTSVAMNQLTSEDVHHWSQFMSPEQPPTPERVRKSGYPVRAGKMRSDAQQRRVPRQVKAALAKHLLQDGKPAYDLHIISCVNENVGGLEYCDDIAEDCLSFDPGLSLPLHSCQLLGHSEGFSASASYPTLFFAEFDNEKKDRAPLLCCPVHEPIAFAEHVRCLYCEAAGARVVHPTSTEFHGGAMSLRR
ncbi:uncharacterized protein [Miscanthus floridulus]|uniref:uncharacterized protein isoform X2 n=1 Tax=Miscanthus floridulus TaxID=154761 RepID=UPI003458A484